MADYKDFVTVAEDEFYTKADVCLHNILWEIEGGINTTTKAYYIDAVRCKSIIPQEENCFAVVVFIRNNRPVHKIRKEFKVGERCSFGSVSSIIIRILKPKVVFMKQLEQRWTADVTFLVNGEKCVANRRYLASVSPVFEKMLYGGFVEAKQNEIPFHDCESANIFEDFMLAISPFRVQPNPNNVKALLQLAHQYDIPFLIHNCEEHLKLRYGMPIVERLILAAKYDLNSLKVHLGQRLSNDELKQIWSEHAKTLREAGVDYLTEIAINRL